MTAVDIPVSTFARFVGATTPSARLKAVSDAKKAYEPAHDYYKGLRDAIIRGHSSGELEEALDEAIDRAHPRRRRSYEECATSYVRFVRRRTFQFERRLRGWRWADGDLTVRVNPEIGVRLGGEPYVLKLWFSPAPGKQGQRALLHLLREGAPRDHQVGLLLVRERIVVPPGAPLPQADAYLGSEADAFMSLWDRLP